jgi:hypothetical protein
MMKVYDSNGKRIRAGDKVVCVKASELAPFAEDSKIGRIFTVTGIGFVNSGINPGNNIILDCHPVFDYTHGIKYISAKPERFLKVYSS